MTPAARMRRRLADRALQLALIAGFVLILVPTSLYLGPAFEQRAFPVLDAHIKVMGEQGSRLVFYVEGWKLRPCPLISVSFAWHYDHSVMPTGAALGNGDVARGQAAAGVVAANEQFLIGPFYAVVPTAVRLAPEPALSVTYYYRCHFLWEVEQHLTAVVALAPPPPPVQLGGTP